jgi:hypothetical protein
MLFALKLLAIAELYIVISELLLQFAENGVAKERPK